MDHDNGNLADPRMPHQTLNKISVGLVNWLRVYGSFSLNFVSFLLLKLQNVTDYCDIRSLFSK